MVPLAFYKFPVSMFYYLISLSRHALLPTGLGRAIIVLGLFLLYVQVLTWLRPVGGVSGVRSAAENGRCVHVRRPNSLELERGWLD